MAHLDPIEILIKLSSTFWKENPKTKVYIDHELIFQNAISEPTEVKWAGFLPEGPHKLIIELYDKDKYQTVIENDKIVKDQLLNIDNISFDEIDIGFLKHTMSTYYPNQVNENDGMSHQIKNCVNLGWNGRWELEFTTPIYIWLLENI